MKKNLLFTLLLVSSILHADTFDDVISIFETKCQSCHSGNTPAGNLDLTGSKSQIHSKIFEMMPFNSTAASNGDKIVDAGYPSRSLLYKKINDGLYHDAPLKDGEGSSMTEYGVEIEAWEKELIRSWIYHGAELNENVPTGSKAIIQDYYTNGGIPKMEKPEEPENGFQLYLGSVFLDQDQEWEMVYKHELNNPEAIEITKIEVFMADFSHHFLFFKYKPGEDLDDAEGFREINLLGFLTGEIAITNDTKMVAGWAYSKAFELPVGTAYTWDANTVLKFNYHIKNYSQSLVFPAELYINVHTQPAGTKLKEMHSDFLIDTNPFASIPANGDTTVLTNKRTDFSEGNNNDTIHIWSLAGHTHSLGVDYDIYLANGNQKGEHIYEAMYDLEYENYTGIYDYSEPPFAVYDDYISIRKGDGLIQEGKFINNTGSSVGFGLTTDDEMLGFFTQYMVGDISELVAYQDSVANAQPPVDVTLINNEQFITIYPNPNNGEFTINFGETTNAKIQIFDVAGRLVSLTNVNNKQFEKVYLNNQPNGIYLVQLNVDGRQYMQKVVKQ